MKTYPTVLILGISVLLICPIHAQTDASKNPAEDLWFKSAQPTLRWPVRIVRDQDIPVPTHVASFYYAHGGRSPKISDLPKTRIWATLSENQRQFCRMPKLWTGVGTNGTALENYSMIRIFAVSEDDARKMARAYVELLNTQFEESRRDIAAQKAALGKSISQKAQDLARDETRHEVVCTQVDKAKQSARYLSLKDSEASEAAKATILRMNTLMDEITIDASEIKAKLTAIEKLKTRESTLSPLRTMEEELTIELAGIEARRETVDRTFAVATQFRQLYLERIALEQQIARNKHTLSTERIKFEKLIAEFDTRHQIVNRPEVYQNKVTIHPAGLQK
jgi:hypothetical protein